LYTWVEKFHSNKIHFDIDLEYLNTNGTFLLVRLLKKIEANALIKHISISWQFDEDDEEHYDIGCLIRKSLTRSEFKFHCNHCSDSSFVEDYLIAFKADCQ